MVWIVVVHDVIRYSCDIYARAKEGRLICHSNQGEKATVAQAPDPDAFGIDIWQCLEVVGGHPCVFGIIAADIHVNSVAPISAISNAATIVGRKDYVALLQQILMIAVVDGVVSLHVPAVIVLIYSVTMDPNDGCMLFTAVEIPGDKEPARHWLTIRPWVPHKLRFNKCGMIDTGWDGIT